VSRRSGVRFLKRPRNASFGSSTIALMLGGLVAGLVVGSVGWTIQQRRHSQALFHVRPFRRLAAIGYLRAHPSVDSARLLHDYLRWEPHPLLRRRARAILRRMEQVLGS
jgi:hypothetical protein